MENDVNQYQPKVFENKVQLRCLLQDRHFIKCYGNPYIIDILFVFRISFVGLNAMSFKSGNRLSIQS